MLEAEKYEQSSSPSSVSDLIDSENCGIDAIQVCVYLESHINLF
ncbi:unnamed protein product [Schistosoma curassoni]|uniref:Uncharacterized protein n=1 Tax=Schistosoma curassoni TaxID=6186 RepID=A0A183KZ27_9TREM|nr:unnamed protein product [Schistosoma curassoni]